MPSPTVTRHATRRRFAGALAAACALSTVAVACASSHHAAPGAAVTPAPRTSSAAHAVHLGYRSPFTGLPTRPGQRVLAVKIDNTHAAHPQIGLNNADVVYVEEVEGGATRLLAIFSSAIPPTVGPVRSARRTDINLLRQYGHVLLAFSGANPGVLSLVLNAPLTATYGDRGDPGFSRASSRFAPYNMFLTTKSTLAAHKRIAKAHDVGFRFSAGPPPGGRPATSVSQSFPFARISFVWSPSHHRWLQSMDGAASTTTHGQRVMTTNVVIQYVDIGTDYFRDVLGNPTPYTTTVGHGTFVLLRDGRRYHGIWRRPSVKGPTSWLNRTGTRPLTFEPGRTWIVMAPKGDPATFS